MANRYVITNNLKEINKKMLEVYNKSPKIADEIVAIITIDILSELKKITPIDTGNLVSNWVQQEVKIALREISNNTEYAPYVFYASKSKHAGKIESLFDRRYKNQIIDKIMKRIKEETERLL